MVLLAVAILSRPVSLLWQSQYLQRGEINGVPIAIGVTLELITLLACALLGSNRLKGIVSASFIFSVIIVSQFPVVYLLALAVYPLLNTRDLLEASAQNPQLNYLGLLLINIIITCCCLLAARWLRTAYSGPTRKQCVLYCLFFVSLAVLLLVWMGYMSTIMTIPFFRISVLLGTLLLGILLAAFYFFTRKTAEKESGHKKIAYEYNQFLGDLSRRELEVIEAVLAGNVSYKGLAAKLNISVNTVKTHLRNIYQTTGTSNIAALLALFYGYSSNHPEVTPKSP